MSHSHTFLSIISHRLRLVEFVQAKTWQVHGLRAFGDSEYSEDVFQLVAKVGLDAFGFALEQLLQRFMPKALNHNAIVY